MKILIAGIGAVGQNLVNTLRQEQHEIHIVDLNQEGLDGFANTEKVFTYHEEIIDCHLFKRKALRDFELFLGITSSDETNIISCKMARDAGIPKTICRLHETFGNRQKKEATFRGLGIDQVINPGEIIADEVYRLIEAPNAVESHIFFEGKLELTGFIIKKNASVIGKSIEEIQTNLFYDPFKVSCLKQGSLTSLEQKDMIAQADDIMYFFSPPEKIHDLRKYLGYYKKKKLRRIFLNGGGKIGFLIAEKLEKKDYQVKIFEINKERCHTLSEQLAKTMVFQGDGSRASILEAEGIDKSDFFISVTNDICSNVMSCITAHLHGAEHTLCLLQEPDYVSLIAKSTPIYLGFSPRLLTSSYLARYIHGEQVITFFPIQNTQIVFLELIVPSHFLEIGFFIKELPEQIAIAAISRRGKILYPKPSGKIFPGDQIIFVIHKKDRTFLLNFFRPETKLSYDS